MPALIADGGFGAVAGINDGIIGHNHQLALDAVYKHFMAASGKITAADAEVEQRIANEHHPVPVEANAAGAVARGMEHRKFEVSEFDDIAILQAYIGIGRRLNRTAHHDADHARRPRRPPAAGLIPMHRERGAGRLFHVAEGHQVVRVTMRRDYYLDIQIQFLHLLHNEVRVGSRIDDNALACALRANDVAVCPERSDFKSAYNHTAIFS